MAGPKKERRARDPIQLLAPFMDVARELARRQQQPVAWLIMKLLADAADAEGLERPALPWEPQE